MLITFEGGEGCGKSTQIKLFEKYLKENNIDYILSREPGGTPLCEKIRTLLLENKEDMNAKTEFLLFSSARAEHVEKVVKPNLEAGKVVVLDRYYHSSYAYQGYAGGQNLNELKAITEFAISFCVPDLVILLDINYEDGFARKSMDEKLKKLDRIESKGKAYHDAVRKGYLKLAQEEKDRFVVIDATKSVEELSKRIIEEFEKRFIHRMHIKEEYLKKIKSGEKNYEVRLYDEKRKRIKRGDMIVFQNGESEVKRYVDNLFTFSTFEEMLDSVPAKNLGFSSKEEALDVYKSLYPKKGDLKVLAIKLKNEKNQEKTKKIKT